MKVSLILYFQSNAVGDLFDQRVGRDRLFVVIGLAAPADEELRFDIKVGFRFADRMNHRLQNTVHLLGARHRIVGVPFPGIFTSSAARQIG